MGVDSFYPHYLTNYDIKIIVYFYYYDIIYISNRNVFGGSASVAYLYSNLTIKPYNHYLLHYIFLGNPSGTILKDDFYMLYISVLLLTHIYVTFSF